MKVTIDMPVVSGCAISQCSYNVNQACHARAITVGNGIHPGCDTFLDAGSHTREKQRQAGVGACKVASCSHNQDFECMAETINVGGGVECLTFTPRSSL